MRDIKKLISVCVACGVLFTASARGSIIYTQVIDYIGFTASEEFPTYSDDAFLLGDTFEFSATFDETKLESGAGSLSWSDALTGFSLVKISGSGLWLPTGTFTSAGYVTDFLSTGMSAYAEGVNQPVLTGTIAALRTVIINLAPGAIFRDVVSTTQKTLEQRLNGPILPFADASSVEFEFFYADNESSGSANFQLIPEPSSALLVSALGLFLLRRKRQSNGQS